MPRLALFSLSLFPLASSRHGGPVVVTTCDELMPLECQSKLAASNPGAEVFEVDGDHSACMARADLFVSALLAARRSIERRVTRA